MSIVVLPTLFGDPEVGATLVPFHSDGLFGIAPLEALAVSTSMVLAATGLVGAVYVIGMIQTWGFQNIFQTSGPIIFVLVFLVVGPLSIGILLDSGHEAIVRTKGEILAPLQETNLRISESITNALNSHDSDSIERLVEQKRQITSLYRDVSDVPDWPLRRAKFAGIASNLLVPLLIPLLIRVIMLRWLRAPGAELETPPGS